MQRCLWLTRTLPYPPYGGDLIYTSRLIEALAATGVEVEVLCNDSGGDLPPESRATWHVVTLTRRPAWASLFGDWPSIVHRSWSEAAERRLSQLLTSERWDAVVFDNLATAWALEPVLAERPPPALAYVSHNHEASVRARVAEHAAGNRLTRFAYRADASKAATLERRLLGAVDLVTANTEVDQALFRRDWSETPCVVITPGYNGPVLTEREITDELPRRAVVVGSFGWRAKQINIEAFLAAASPVFAAAAVELEVIGALPAGFASALSRRYPFARFYREVPDLTPHLQRARLAVMPEEIGGGFKHKLLDFVFSRLPVASLPGCLAGTPLLPGESVLEFDSMRSLAEGAVSAIDDLPRLDRLQEAAFTACVGRFDWRERGRDLAAALDTAQAARRVELWRESA